MSNASVSAETVTQIVLNLHCRAGLQVAVYPDFDEAKADVVRIVGERGGDEALKALAVYNGGRMYEWTGRYDHRRFDQYTIHLTPVAAGELATVYQRRLAARDALAKAGLPHGIAHRAWC
ncbi:MAG TPA: hypothetical protein VH678_15205 [Xanthobacteraceae bacterium]|jgi:hypothetical protein